MIDRKLPHGGGILLGFAIMVPLWLVACASGPAVRIDARYKTLGAVKRIVVADAELVDRECFDPNGREDDGTSMRFREVEHVILDANGRQAATYTTHMNVMACWTPMVGTIWLSTLATVKVFLHELCHAGMGMSEKECMKQFPGY